MLISGIHSYLHAFIHSAQLSPLSIFSLFIFYLLDDTLNYSAVIPGRGCITLIISAFIRLSLNTRLTIISYRFIRPPLLLSVVDLSPGICPSLNAPARLPLIMNMYFLCLDMRGRRRRLKKKGGWGKEEADV